MDEDLVTEEVGRNAVGVSPCQLQPSLVPKKQSILNVCRQSIFAPRCSETMEVPLPNLTESTY